MRGTANRFANASQLHSYHHLAESRGMAESNDNLNHNLGGGISRRRLPAKLPPEEVKKL